MPALAHQHCLNHSVREAVAQCPQCRHFFCRECIVEHDDRVLCAACLKKLSGTKGVSWSRGRLLGRAALAMAGLLTAGLFFYWVATLLLMIPAPFHDGTLWKIFGGSE